MTAVGSGTVTTPDGFINCHAGVGTCSHTYASGAAVTIDQAPDSNALFSSWSGDCTGSGVCTVVMTAAHNVTATFINTWALTVTSVTGSGTVTSSPAGITCTDVGGTCTTRFNQGTVVTLTQAPASGWVFDAWNGDCSGSGPCSVTMNADHVVGANFLGPFDFALGTTLPSNQISLVQGESRTFPVSVSLTAGAALPVNLSATGLPAGVTAAFAPSTVTPNGTSTLTLTASAGAVPGQVTVTLSGVNGTTTRTRDFELRVYSPRQLDAPYGLAIEPGETTALVTDNGTGNGSNWHRLVRIDTATRFVVKTIADGTTSLRRIALESGATSVLVASGSGLLRATLATGAMTAITTPNATGIVEGIAIEASGATALVTDCGPGGNCTAGRVDRINLSTGAITTLTTIGLQFPEAIALEPGGTTAVLTEHGSGRVVRVTLSSGALLPLVTGFTYPRALTMEAGGATALVSHIYGTIARVDLATGIATQIETVPEVDIDGVPSLAIEAGGIRALVVHSFVAGRVTRVPLPSSVRALTPARQSLDVLTRTIGVAIEPGGATALVTDCAPGCGLNSGQVVRVTLATGMVTPIATGLGRLRGIAVEPGGTSALFVDYTAGAGLLQRINLATAAVTTLATGLSGAMDVAPEANGTTALVLQVTTGTIVRVTLATGAQTTLATFTNCSREAGMALEAGGATVLVTNVYTDPSCESAHGLARINLGTGAVTQLSLGMKFPLGVAIESGGTTALVTDSWAGSSVRLLRVNLATGVFSVVGPQLGDTSLGLAAGNAQFLKLEASGAALVAISNGQVLRVTDAPVVATSLGRGLDDPKGLAFTPGGVLVLDCGGLGDCKVSGRLASVNVTTGALTPIATTLNTPNAVALEAGNATALVTACGPSNQDCATSGRVLRVTLANGAVALVGGGLNNPDGIAIEAGGATALIAERGSGNLLRMDLASGTFTIVASALGGVRGVVIEAGGTTALVVANNVLVRVNLLASGATSVVASVYIERFVVEPGGATALLAWRGGLLGASSGQFGRVNLTTGAVTVLAMPYFDLVHSLAFDATGSTLYYTDNVGPGVGNPSTSGTLFAIAAP